MQACNCLYWLYIKLWHFHWTVTVESDKINGNANKEKYNIIIKFVDIMNIPEEGVLWVCLSHLSNI